MKKVLTLLILISVSYLQILASNQSAAPDSYLRDVILKTKVENDTKVTLDLYVMSQCPFGVRAEKFMIPILNEMGEDIKFNLHFIVSEDEKGELQSLHGTAEILENRRQLIIARHQSDKFLAYLNERGNNYYKDEWKAAAAAADIDVALVEQLMNDKAELLAFRENIALSNIKRINASPTLFINGQRYRGGFAVKTAKVANAGTCVGGSEPGSGCDADGDCDDACVGGSNAGGMCTGEPDCPNVCDGGFDAGNNCTADVDCDNVCVGGATVGAECTVDADCPNACIGGTNDGTACINDLACTGGGTCTDMGTCPNTAFCDIGSCTNEGTCNIPAPVELAFFKAKITDQNTINLTWKTLSEIDNEGFEVQRSVDGRDWETLVFVEGMGSTVEEQNYEWIDEDPQVGISYYRLVQYDFGGASHIHKTEVVEFNPENSIIVQAFPNPTHDYTSLYIPSHKDTQANVFIINTAGKMVRVVSKQLQTGDNILLLDMTNLPKGNYFIFLEEEGKVLSKSKIMVN